MTNVTAHRLRELGGAARLQDLGRVAGARAALRAAVASGRVVRPVRGVYALADADRVAIAAATHCATIACISAVERFGIAVLEPSRTPHLAVPRDRGRSESLVRSAQDVVLHREAWARSGPLEGVAVAPLDEALARMLLCCSAEAALVSIDDALHRGRTTTARIAAALPSTAPVWARVVLGRADGRSMSPLETLTRLALRAAGLVVEPGPLVPRVGYVDLIVAGRVVVELDGYEFHSGRIQFQDDRRRDRELVAQGYVVLRFTYTDVTHDMAGVVAAVKAACARLTSPR